eukprot:TRINITY_DN11096_c0_g1_i3.p1 TRINITY_DN11096_c0_g1~~TRINITY_DN11096_c0_g1_i3.p1  ORF type:complete len:565 (-),score=90.58 TRINITY_DN11096_c0_g1_i3:376-1848(-)
MAEDYRVVVVMTTIPKRIHRIEPVLDSMLAQTWPIRELYLNIPDKYNRTGEPYVIPEWLQKKQGVKIVRCEDLGPGTHLLNGLRLEQDPWTFLAVVDDDHIYSPELVETLMRGALAYPGTAVAAQGFLSIPGLLNSAEITSFEESGFKRPRYLHDQGFTAGPVLVSYLGVVYQRGFFDDSVFDYSWASNQCRYQDDMWFSAHLAKKGIRRNVIGAALGVQELTDMHLGPESLTYWEDNKPRGISDDCNLAMLLQDSTLWTYRRRVVLALGGLPPPPAGLWSNSEVSAEWQSVLTALKSLRRLPDLVYLCTEGWGPQFQPATQQDELSRKRGAVGSSFWLEDVLVTGSDACKPNAAEPRVMSLLHNPLQWEGDPNTIVVFGTLKDVQPSAQNDIWAAADCAADMYDANQVDAEDDSQISQSQGEVSAKDLEKRSVKEMSDIFKFQSKMQGVGELAGVQRKFHTTDRVINWPFCRLSNGLGAVSIGAFTATS